MWDLDNRSEYNLFHKFKFPDTFTYADMRPGHKDKDKRNLIRQHASSGFSASIPSSVWWAFRISVIRGTDKKKMFDIENVPKLIIDSFCKKQIKADGSAYLHLGLYSDDTIEDVRLIEVGGILDNL